jgi:hypothetical protein
LGKLKKQFSKSRGHYEKVGILLSSGKNIAWNSTQLQINYFVLRGHYCIKSIQKTSGLSKSKLQLLNWSNHQLFSYCPVVFYDFLIFQTIHLFKLTLSNKLQNYLNVFCKKVKMESSKRTRVVLLAREKRAIRNDYEEQTKK